MRIYLLAFFAVAASAFGQSITWIQQPTSTVGELGGAAQFAFVVRNSPAFGNLSVRAQSVNSGNVSSRFTIVSQRIGNAASGSGSYTEGEYTVQISNLTDADAGSYYFQIFVNGSEASPFSQVVTLRVVPELPPTISAQPANVDAFIGGVATFSVTARANNLVYQWRKDGIAILGATGSTLALQNVQSANAGAYTVTVSNSAGTVTSTPAVLSVGPAVAPAILVQPQPITVREGESGALSVSTNGIPTPTFVWRRNGSVIVGATGASLRFPSVAVGDAGIYDVTATNSAGTVTSIPAAVNVIPNVQPGRLANLAILTELQRSEAFTMGFVVGGASARGSKPVIVRAAGPSLAIYGVSEALPDPKIALFNGGIQSAENDNWGGGSDLSAAMAEVGAFPFTSATSRDAAALAVVTTRDNTIRLSDAGGNTGSVLAEIYDASSPTTFHTGTPRLVNASVLKAIGNGITAGFVVGGETPLKVLVRAVGPTLRNAPFNVDGAAVDPALTLYRGVNVIATNDNWLAADASVFTAVGAFALPAGSKDSALVISLPPGDYTASAATDNDPTGNVLLEVYEVR